MARALRRRAADNNVPLDMTPMIDCIFLLLIFFILTSRFVPDELAIASLMPTDKGGHIVSPPIVSEQINIKIFPAGMTRGHKPSDYRKQLADLRALRRGPIDAVCIQVGGETPLEIRGGPLGQAGGSETTTEMERVHAHLRDALDVRKPSASEPGSPAQPIVIHCFSGLPWKFALIAYDAVRDYERVASGGSQPSTRAELIAAREVTFAPPRLRNFSPNEVGSELEEIIHLR